MVEFQAQKATGQDAEAIQLGQDNKRVGDLSQGPK
jgi:hypothetical protein